MKELAISGAATIATANIITIYLPNPSSLQDITWSECINFSRNNLFI
jgi:hypothetical protein